MCKRSSVFISSQGRPRYSSIALSPAGGTGGYDDNNESVVVLTGGRSRKGKFRGPPRSKDLGTALKNCVDPQFVDFMYRCLEFDPSLRMTPSQALQHPWMRGRGAKKNK